MSEYGAACRTNWFRVTDPERLRRIIARAETLQGNPIMLWKSKDKQQRDVYAFGCYGTIDVYEYDTDDDDDYEYSSFIADLSEILPDDEAIVISEIENEKLQYLVAYTIVVTKYEIRTVDLFNTSVQEAEEMLCDTKYATDFYGCGEVVAL